MAGMMPSVLDRYSKASTASSSVTGVAGSRKLNAELPIAIPEDVQEVVKNFRAIADEASGMLRGYLKKARLSLGGDNRLMIVLPVIMMILGIVIWASRRKK